MSEENEEQEPIDNEEEDEGEFSDTFLSAEEADGEISLILIPKLDYDLDEALRSCIKILKRCPTTEIALSVLHELCEQVRIITTIENEVEDIQFKAENLEAMMKQIKKQQ